MEFVGIGVDILQIDRVSEPDKLAKKILSENELIMFSSIDESVKQQYIAGRFAAKEAILKAFGIGIGSYIALHEIEIHAENKKKPKVKYKDFIIDVSISHDGLYVVANAIIFK